jgi:LPS export ABC transporter permease LptF/LPS export ABC transporter permease LptG
MRIFTRYILREVTSYAVLGGVLFTFVLFMRDLSKILEMVVRDSASMTDVLRLFAYTLPNTLTVTIPTAVLAGILLGLSRLAADSEITAMRACGVGALKFVRIVSILSLSALAFGLFNALYLAPSGARNLLRLEDQLKSSQASFVVEPRVFYEDFRNYVLYVQDVRPTAGTSVWHHVFLADLTQPTSPHITTAEQAVVATSEAKVAEGLRLHLIDGGEHQISPTDPNQYTITTFGDTEVPIQLESQDDTHISRMDTPLHALTLGDLWKRTRGVPTPGKSAVSAAEQRAARIEFNIRFSYPFACLVLTLIGVPLGLSSKRGGKSTGFVLTLMLVFSYYLISNIGVALAKSGKVSPLLGVWGANLIFAAFGSILLQQLAGGGFLISFFTSFGAAVSKRFASFVPARIANIFGRSAGKPVEAERSAEGGSRDFGSAPQLTLVQRLRMLFRTSFPLLLDEYVLRAYLTNFALALGSFAVLFVIFTFFELIGDIIRNQTPFTTVASYLFNLLPFVVNTVTPFCSLLAVLITFGSLNRTSELTAMKATGISLYRVVVPVVLLAALLAVALFAFDETYLPDANRRQEALRAEIKGKPAQTFLRPDRKWISGQSGRPDEASRIFYYQFFDADRDTFANLTVFEFNPQTFNLERRIFASTVHWDPSVSRWIFDNGWQRTFAGDAIAAYQPFTVSTFPDIRELPAYFKKEDKPSQEMSYVELQRYIVDLKQSGFNTVALSVQLQRKLADPVITLIMAMLGVPFAVSMGRRGGLSGIAVAVVLAMVYIGTAALFSAMGDVDTLPPLLAAWSPDLLFGFAGAYLLLRTPT